MIPFMVIFWFSLCAIYFMLDPKIAVPTFIAYLPFFQLVVMPLVNADEKSNLLGGNAFNIIFGIQAFGWLTQIIGHAIFEERAPAVLTNFLFMFIAPFFHSFELAQKLFDYKHS